MKWKYLETKIERWNFKKNLENSRETRLLLVTETITCQYWLVEDKNEHLTKHYLKVLVNMFLDLRLKKNKSKVWKKKKVESKFLLPIYFAWYTVVGFGGWEKLLHKKVGSSNTTIDCFLYSWVKHNCCSNERIFHTFL